jgi:ligand-binding SRPBCC domain-containing protein
MTEIKYEIEIDVPVSVYEYYTDPENIKKAWPSDIVKDSDISGTKNLEGTEMKIKGEFMGQEEQMKLEVIQKEENKKLVTKQTEGPFKRWENVQEFQGKGNSTHVKHAINYELPTTGKIANLLSGSQADNKLRVPKTSRKHSQTKARVWSKLDNT